MPGEDAYTCCLSSSIELPSTTATLDVTEAPLTQGLAWMDPD